MNRRAESVEVDLRDGLRKSGPDIDAHARLAIVEPFPQFAFGRSGALDLGCLTLLRKLKAVSRKGSSARSPAFGRAAFSCAGGGVSHTKNYALFNDGKAFGR